MFTSKVMVKNGWIFLFSAYNSTKTVTVWAKYLSTSERPHLSAFEKTYLALPENAMDYWVLSFH